MKNVIYLILGIALLGGLFVAMKPQPTSELPAAKTQAASTTVAATPHEFTLQIRGGQLMSGPEVIRLTQGDELVLHITSDIADEFHLHGYDMELSLQPGVRSTLRLKAQLSGRFGYELHHAHAELGALEVLPR